MRTTAFTMVLAFALAAGCRTDPHDHPPASSDDHGESGHGDDEHGHGHGDDEGAAEVVTVWGERTQLFAEFPALVVGEDSPFAAHLTRLHDHAAIARGAVVVELEAAGRETERFSVDGTARPGIFRPVVRPTHAGAHTVTLRLTSEEASEVHLMGVFTVYATRAEADARPHGDAPPGTISYLLEQQWQVPFQLARAEERLLRPSLPAFGHLALPRDAEAIITAPRDGRLLLTDPPFPTVGDEVAAGAVIFALTATPADHVDPASLDLDVEQAQIRASTARRDVDRLAPLVEQGVVARRRLDDARSALSEAQAALRSARRRKASVGQSQRVVAGGDGFDVPTPLSGVIAETFVAPGAWVAAGQRLARVVNRDRLWLDIGVPEVYVGRLRDISGAWFAIDGVPGERAVGADALVSIGTEVNAETRTLAVRFRVDNTDRALFAGMTTDAHLIVDAPGPALAVPLEAIVDDGGTEVAYVQTGGESFERRTVELGLRDGPYVAVISGIAAGEWVVARGAWSVRLASLSTASIGHGHAH